MRRVYSFFLIPFLFFVTNCNSLKDLAVIGIPMQFEKTFAVVVDDVTDLTYNASDTIDFTDNADVEANLDNIKRYEIKKITYSIADVVSDAENPTLLNGEITYSADGQDQNSVVAILENIDLVEAQENSADAGLELSYSSEELELLSEILINGNKVILSYEATMDTVVNFTIAVSLDVSLKIGI